MDVTIVRISNQTKTKMTPYLLLALPMTIALGLILYPILTVFYYSLFSYFPARPYLNGFIGLENFANLWKDKLFWQALQVSIRWIFTQVPLQLIFGLCLALLLNRSFRGRGIVRALTFAPWSLSGVIVAIMWTFLFNGNMGFINEVLKRVGVIDKSVAWLANPDTVFGAVSVAELWRGIPFFAISLLASLQSIPLELYESCDIDGGGRFSKFFYITLPYLKNTIILTTLLRTVWEFNAVDVIMVATGGGPLGKTTTLSIFLADLAIKNRNFGYGSAVGVTSFCIMFAFAVLYLKSSGFGGAEK